MDFIKKSMLAGVGLAALTREKLEKTVDELIKKGEMTEKEGKEAIEELTEKSKEFKKELTKKVEKTVSDIIARLDIPTRKEFAALKSKIEKMEKSRKTKA
ncbi:MAG: phasin family protein [Deltaproteobacteria bacterium]|nr:phasin family protein [Deltaproteobacteria bacterium]